MRKAAQSEFSRLLARKGIDPQTPMTVEDVMTPRAQIEAKFRTYAKARLPAANVDAVINAVNRLEDFASARELMQLLRAGKPA